MFKKMFLSFFIVVCFLLLKRYVAKNENMQHQWQIDV